MNRMRRKMDSLLILPHLKGGCYCKKIRYEILDDIIKTGVCHCRSCQHLTGGSFYPFIVIKRESIAIVGDIREFPRIGSSGQIVHYGFCPFCGSTLFGRPEVWPHIITVSASSLDDISNFKPSMHVWVEEAQPWIILDHNIPTFEKNPI